MTEDISPTQKSIESYTATMEGLRKGGQLDKYIEYAVFPNFKNLEYGSRIDFIFPITAIIGPNGSGKSSLLHALYGMPYRYSTSRFWFSTNLDPIEEGKEKGPNRYFYSHFIKDLRKTVETKKIRRRRNEAYWEPARVSQPDGMAGIPKEYSKKESDFRSSDRWYPPFRKSIYISFKYQFSAFDRAFHINNARLGVAERIEKMKKGARKINNVVSRELASYKPGGVEAVFKHRLLSADEVQWVNFILGKQYVEARYIEHRLYENGRGTSVIFKTAAETYSEAFAGSGELAVVSLVTKLINGSEFDLILLDEPETSLHPGAQEKLVKFLMWSVQCKRYQVVISTHSPTIAQLLPKEALYALLETDQGRTAISKVEHPHMVFSRIGHIPENKKLVIVEDQLLLKIVEVAADSLDDWKKERLEFHLPASGGDEIFKFLLPMHIRERRDVNYILDGDKKEKVSLDLSEIEGLSGLETYQKIKDAYSCEPLHLKKDDKDSCVKYVERALERVHYLDAACPEIVFLELLQGEEKGHLSNQDAKEELVSFLDNNKYGSTAGEQHILFNYYLRQRKPNKYIEKITEILDKISVS